MRIFLIAILLVSGVCLSAKWDVEYWQQLNLKNWECGPWKVYTTAEFRFNHDCSYRYYNRGTQCVAFRLFPFLELEAHYSYIYDKPFGALSFLHRQRLELEINPFTKLENGITVRWRNRLELVKRQHDPKIRYEFRHRVMASIPIDNGTTLQAIRIYNELFYNFERQKFAQNRFVPIELSFKLGKSLTVDTFVMIRNFLNSDRWFRSIVFGGNLLF